MACMRRALLVLFVAAAVVALSSTPAAAILDAEKTVFTSFNIPNDTSGKPVSSGVRGEEVRGGARAAGLERAREKRMGSRFLRCWSESPRHPACPLAGGGACVATPAHASLSLASQCLHTPRIVCRRRARQAACCVPRGPGETMKPQPAGRPACWAPHVAVRCDPVPPPRRGTRPTPWIHNLLKTTAWGVVGGQEAGGVR